MAVQGVLVSLSRALCRRCRLYAVSGAACGNGTGHPPWGHASIMRFSSPSAALKTEPSSTTETDASTQQQHWRIVAAACIQRMPTLSREKTALELKHEEMRDQVRLERSKLSDHELEEREVESMKKARIKKAQEEGTSIKGLSDERTEEFEDIHESREIELQEFEPAPRVTEEDRTGDMRSLNRQLSRVLYLLVKKPREEHAWQMPQGGVEGEESLLDAVKREFSEECGSSMQVKFYSNTPWAVFSYKHTPASQQAPSGSKVFFMKAFYQSGTLELDGKELVDYAWVTKDEMKDYVSREYFQAVEPILTE